MPTLLTAMPKGKHTPGQEVHMDFGHAHHIYCVTKDQVGTSQRLLRMNPSVIVIPPPVPSLH